MKISEIFYSIQGEGSMTGTPMVFVRLAGCNLSCSFCDTPQGFTEGQEMQEAEIVKAVESFAPAWVCITGGEPYFQDLSKLVGLFKSRGFRVQIETNGTIFQAIEPDWLVISPKREKEPDVEMLKRADEIKLVVESASDLDRASLFNAHGSRHSIQPVSNSEVATKLCVDFVKANPEWKLSLQIHKLIGIE